jgi:hypothetical protein
LDRTFYNKINRLLALDRFGNSEKKNHWKKGFQIRVPAGSNVLDAPDPKPGEGAFWGAAAVCLESEIEWNATHKKGQKNGAAPK